MPSTRAGTTTIEVSIPWRVARGLGGGGTAAGVLRASDDDLACHICASGFCDHEGGCARAMTHLACCTQPICAGCLLRSAKRCTCKDECDAVVALCPFCREISPVEALDVFLGHKGACGACATADLAAATAVVPADPTADADELAALLDMVGRAPAAVAV